jgi:beta-aspartyl-peptidase (threonine type)
MKPAALALLALLASAPLSAQDTAAAAPPSADTSRPRFMLVVHGGAGVIRRADMSAEEERAYRAALAEAIGRGRDVLARGGHALDAVEAVINVLEDSPLFNAGRGAVFTNAGTNELDAAMMDGSTGRAGAVAGVRRVKNPIDLARAVMEKSAHVMLVGDGAEAFATAQGIELVDPKYFHTERRWKALQEARRKEAEAAAGKRTSQAPSRDWRERKLGTVGAVALDAEGRLAAGTSTGGMTNKRWGRVGDAPIVGAGTYADDRCAVSATGHGEYFIRNVVAHDICARMRYGGVSLREAADDVVMKKLVELKGEGGVIALDAAGNVAAPFNSEGMFRGWVGPDGRIEVRIYRDEER